MSAARAASIPVRASLAFSWATQFRSAAAYQLPFPVHGAGAAVSLATVLEDRLCAAYLGLVGLANPALRAFGARAARTAALRAAAWRGSTLAFPGLNLPAPVRAAAPAAAGSAAR